MNHSSFIDLSIVATLLYPKPFNIVTTTDGFIGKNWLMRMIGCIPTKKFVSDLSLIHDMNYALTTLRSSVVLFPEAGYSFDGTATVLPESLGKCIKLLKAPVVMIKTEGAFLRDPLYNNLQVRRVKVSATEKFLLSKEELEALSCEEINEIVKREFSFDGFREQAESQTRITEPTRADYLNRILYKCPECLAEGSMLGKGTEITCKKCGKTHIMTELGTLEAKDGKTSFSHIPDWFAWERECVRREIEEGKYSMDIPVDICMTVDTKNIYRVGEGRLTHTKDEGFRLTGCDGKLDYQQKPLASYTLNSDFNWYEIGDVIGIGNHEALYYCFPKTSGDIVAKARLATEEIYKIAREEHKPKHPCGAENCKHPTCEEK